MRSTRSPLKLTLLAAATALASAYGLAVSPFEKLASLWGGSGSVLAMNQQHVRTKGSFKQKASISARIAARRSHRVKQRNLRSRR